MIESIHIKNFKCHKDTYLEFSKGVNVLVGLSDHGKSAVLRAIRWVVKNLPSGDNYKSWWGGDTEVTLVVNGNEVTRIRTNNDGKNGYILNGEYLKSGVGLPEPVKEVLKFSDVNLQMQDDQFFLLSKSPPEVARYLNKIVNLDKIDEAHKNINTKLLDINKKAAFVGKELGEQEGNIGKYGWIEEAGKDLQFYTEINLEMNKLTNDINELQPIIESIKIQENKRRGMDWLQNARDDVEELESLVEDMEETESKKDELELVISSIVNNEKGLARLQEKINDDKSNFEINMPNICPLCEQEIEK